MKSTVILCADDFGISAGVNRAILDLAAQGRLSAVSCMSVGPAFAAGMEALKPLKGKIDVGLHLTFTSLPPLTKELGERFGALEPLILKSWGSMLLELLFLGNSMWGLNEELVKEEIRAQFEKFAEIWGAPPDFIDGHQHVHVLPVIRNMMLRVRAEMAPQAWIRNVCDFSAVKESGKSAVMAVLGWVLMRQMQIYNIPHNKRLRGAYDYTKPVDYAALMARWCALTEPVLIYCHPGFPDAGLAKFDTVLEPRRKEYDFFSSGLFRTWLEQQQVKLVRRP